MKKIILSLALVGLIAAGCAKTPVDKPADAKPDNNQSSSDRPVPTPTPTPSPVSGNQGIAVGEPYYSDGNDVEAVPMPEVRQVDIIANGFSPSTITIKKGDYVVFVNKDTEQHWPASNPHPEHTVLPDFDAEKGLKQNEKYQYQFMKAGTWSYHDHLDASTGGKVIVE